MKPFSHFLPPRCSPALGSAALASLLVHLALGSALATFFSIHPFALGLAAPALAVALAPPQPKVQDQLAASPLAPPAVPISHVLPAPLPVRPALAETPVAAPSPPVLVLAPERIDPPATKADASLTIGQIQIADDYAGLSGLPEALVLRTQGEFLVEVDKLAQVARVPEVTYPAEALAAKRDGRVVVWLALSREGSLEETIIVSGEPEFAAAVEAALPSAQFLPAENGGQMVPFYIIMTFDFRSG